MKIAVIGAGSWGTALSQLLARNGHNVSLWARRPEVVSAINKEHRNPRYLSDVQLHDDVVATLSHADAVLRARAVVVVTPSNLLRGVARALADCVDSSFPVIICSKGVEEGSGLLPHEVFAGEMGNPERIAALSGPNHAEEVIRGIPSGTVIASQSADTAQLFRDAFSGSAFRCYTSSDITGVELCGAFKNVIAIAVGISYGMGFGDNTAAMLMTRGMAEMSRLVEQAGGQPLTCMGLAGAGDLIATCTSEHSRNRRFGKMVAEGKTLDDFTAETHMVAEGALACRNIGALASHYDVELPILDAVRQVVWEGADPIVLGKMLAERPLKPEFY
ncbi:MAG: NAD(P)H-dependent glycerol-3-phosphate dehydrogenase [Eggerthellaceae bacterium]|nr:NAD(P)H-dependent glycerol-3-phosphate dehydrogenase [Eggerthellaceae bacterium]